MLLTSYSKEQAGRSVIARVAEESGVFSIDSTGPTNITFDVFWHHYQTSFGELEPYIPDSRMASAHSLRADLAEADLSDLALAVTALEIRRARDDFRDLTVRSDVNVSAIEWSLATYRFRRQTVLDRLDFGLSPEFVEEFEALRRYYERSVAELCNLDTCGHLWYREVWFGESSELDPV